MAEVERFEFSGPVWRYPGADGWHFVSVPPDVSASIADIGTGIRRGFGSVRVAATIGATSWRTSLFPDSKSETYLLPVKKAVRSAENLGAGDEIWARLEIVDL